MNKVENLIRINKYCLFTFQATAHALKAEKVLKSANSEFTIIPTLREISTSCGLSIKVRPDNFDVTSQILATHKIPIDGIYRVEKQGKKNFIEELALS